MESSFRVEHRPICASTSDALKEIVLAEGPKTDGLCLYTDEQPQGRGRKARDWWLGPVAENLAFSCAVFEPPTPSESLAVLAAVSLADVLSEVLADDMAENSHQAVGLKWPNDVLVDDKKIAGILAELVSDQHQNSIAVIGIGLNLQSAPPIELVDYPTTCLENWVKNLPPRIDVMQAWWNIFTAHKKTLLANGPSFLETQFLTYLQVWAASGLHHPQHGNLGSPSAFSFADGLLCDGNPQAIAITQLDGLRVVPSPASDRGHHSNPSDR
jgi:biotin-[acetyl-CoA-carboxylase] ligase BirA-like protein